MPDPPLIDGGVVTSKDPAPSQATAGGHDTPLEQPFPFGDPTERSHCLSATGGILSPVPYPNRGSGGVDFSALRPHAVGWRLRAVGQEKIV